LTHRQIKIVFTGLMLGMFLAALDQSIVATALPTIVGDLGGLNKLSWVVTVYLLSSTVSTPIYGKLGDLFGRKIVFQAAISLFLVGSMLSGLSHTIIQLIIFRLVQGLGAGGIFTSVMSIIGDILSPRERGKYQAYLTATFTFASVSGPAIGGLFTQHLSWRWCFYVNVPIGLVTLVVTSVVLNLSFTRVRHKIDYFGVMLFCTSITALLLATVWGRAEYAWTSPTMLTLIFGGIALLGVFVWWERRATEPLLPLRLFRNRTFALLNSAGFLVFAAMFGTIVYLPLFLQLVTGASPTFSGVLIMPNSLAGALAGVLMGRRVAKTGHYRKIPIFGAGLTTIALSLLTLLTPTTPFFVAAIFMTMLGFGSGLMVPVMLIAIQNAVPKEDLGSATSAHLFFRSMGSSIAVAVFGSVMNARLRYWFPRLLPHGVGNHLSAAQVAFSPAAVHLLAADVRVGIVDAFARSLHVVFICAVPLCAATIPLLILLREIPLRTGAHVVSNEFEAEASSLLVEAPKELEMVGESGPDGAPFAGSSRA
jgi:EmrB/QacA subfamily drug resistance transporter